jgi:hypothetical protein
MMRLTSLRFVVALLAAGAASAEPQPISELVHHLHQSGVNKFIFAEVHSKRHNLEILNRILSPLASDGPARFWRETSRDMSTGDLEARMAERRLHDADLDMLGYLSFPLMARDEHRQREQHPEFIEFERLMDHPDVSLAPMGFYDAHAGRQDIQRFIDFEGGAAVASLGAAHALLQPYSRFYNFAPWEHPLRFWFQDPMALLRMGSTGSYSLVNWNMKGSDEQIAHQYGAFNRTIASGQPAALIFDDNVAQMFSRQRLYDYYANQGYVVAEFPGRYGSSPYKATVIVPAAFLAGIASHFDSLEGFAGVSLFCNVRGFGCRRVEGSTLRDEL